MVIVFDLDDTLYDEIEFVKSGFKEVASYLGDDSYFSFMIKTFKKEGSGKIFNALIDRYELKTPIEKLIQIYKFHTPKIALKDDSLELLEFAKGYKSALISDGDYIMQKNKFKALGLENYIKFQVFTDFYHTKKPDIKPYKIVMEEFKNEKYVYIADNPKKDFIAPKKLGWKSIRYKNSNGIYKNEYGDFDFEVKDKKDIIKIIKELS